MAIDFHDPAQRGSYASRDAHSDWTQAMRDLVDARGLHVVDIGCGGGIYSAAWADLGASRVTGVDFSAQMVSDARALTKDRAGVVIRQAEATATGLPSGSADIVFARALIHHLPDRPAFLREVWRVAAPGGLCILQDRTREDAALPGTPDHLRGFFFEVFPRLAAVEQGRRPDRAAVEDDLIAAGFVAIGCAPLWETRRMHADRAALSADLRARTGRSILHELTDPELERLIAHIAARLPDQGPLIERDRWTLWWGRKPTEA